MDDSSRKITEIIYIKEEVAVALAQIIYIKCMEIFGIIFYTREFRIENVQNAGK